MFGISLKKQLPVIAIIALIVLLVGILIWQRSGGINLAERKGPAAILFWGSGCSHCEELMAGDIYKQAFKTLNLSTKETWNSTKNAEEMEVAFADCATPLTEQGVPFLYIAETHDCAVGPPNIEGVLTALMDETYNLSAPVLTLDASPAAEASRAGNE
jgi:hypothetical protein